MKKDTLTFIIALAIVLLAVFLYNFAPLKLHQDSPVAETPTLENGPATGKVCYLYHITTPGGEDNTYLDVTFGENGLVSGQFNLLPAEKDKLVGPYAGTWVESTSTIVMSVNHTYAAEGTTGTENRIFRLAENGAQISFDNGATFPLTLPQVDCDEVPANIVSGL